MKIAVIDHFGNPGGGSRVVSALIPAILRSDPKNKITYFGGRDAIRREGIDVSFKQCGISILYLSSSKIKIHKILNSDLYPRVKAGFKSPLVNLLFKFLERVMGSRIMSLNYEIEKLVQDFDIAFFPWPFHIDCPNLKMPMVGIFHDLNYKYYFSGSQTFSNSSRYDAERRMPIWLDRCVPIVSSKFIASELKKFYPSVTGNLNVIHLPRLSNTPSCDKEFAANVVRELGINIPFILYPTHMVSHKNIGPLLSAIDLLINRNYKLMLVLTGSGTESIRGIANSIGVELNKANYNVLGLGYVSAEQIDCLISCASVVVNCSLYEAGNGSGVDAWAAGTPVAMSNIPAFVENLSVLDVKAEVFDPRSPLDICNKISQIIDNPLDYSSFAKYSKDSMSKISWEGVAVEYLNVFKKYV